MEYGITIGFIISIGVPILFFIGYKIAPLIDNFPLREPLAVFLTRNKAYLQDFEKIKTNKNYAISICNSIDIPYASAFFHTKYNPIDIDNKLKINNFHNFFIENTHIIDTNLIVLVKCDYRTYREVTQRDLYDQEFGGNSFYVLKKGKPVLVKLGDEVEESISIFYEYFCMKYQADTQKLTIYSNFQSDNGMRIAMKIFAKEILDKMTNY
jgi:hypothetical protein